MAAPGAEATKLAAASSVESQSDAIGSAVATASAAAVGSAATPPPAALQTAAVQPPAAVTPVAAAGFAADASAPTPPLRAPAEGTQIAAAPAEAQQLAAVAPPPRPQSAPVQLRPRRHDPPEFPARALRARIFEGHVLAHIWVTAEGKVDQVDIVSATPERIFDDAVKRTLSKWTFDPPGRATDTSVEFDFKP
jgi:TonB family protein